MLSGRFVREALALVLLLLAIVSVIALFAPDAGAIVKPWHGLLSTGLGWGIAFAPPLLAGFALMLWMKTMPAERWMAATGAALVVQDYPLVSGVAIAADALADAVQGLPFVAAVKAESPPTSVSDCQTAP